MIRGRLVSLAAAVMAALGGAASTGLVAAQAVMQVGTKREDDDPPALLIAPPIQPPILLAGHSSHRSHSSHSSHSSHVSGSGYRPSHYSGSGVGRAVDSESYGAATQVSERPPRPKPARVSLVAFPGGLILLDDKPVGRDSTGTLVLKPGRYQVRIRNRFLGDYTTSIFIEDAQTGVVKIDW